MASAAGELPLEFRGGTLRSAWTPLLRLLFALCALSCIGIGLDGTMRPVQQTVTLSVGLGFAGLVLRSFFVRLTVSPSGAVRRVGWGRSEEVGPVSARPVVIRSGFSRYAWAPLVRRQDGTEQVLMGLAAYSQSPADISPRVLDACRMLNGLPRL